MNPITHFLASWCLANTAEISRRDRFLVTAAGVVPDLDGLGAIAYYLSKDAPNPSTLYHDYHHVLTHNLLSCLALTALCFFFLAHRRGITSLLVFSSFHLHLLCDLLGSRGPDGFQWPIHYLWPWDGSLLLIWEGQWELVSWQNTLFTFGLILATLFLARKRGFSFLDFISKSLDARFVEALRRR